MTPQLWHIRKVGNVVEHTLTLLGLWYFASGFTLKAEPVSSDQAIDSIS